MTAKFWDVFFESYQAKAGGDTRAQTLRGLFVILDRIPKDFASFLLRATAVASRTLLKLLLHIIFELANQNLSHRERMISRSRRNYCCTSSTFPLFRL